MMIMIWCYGDYDADADIIVNEIIWRMYSFNFVVK